MKESDLLNALKQNPFVLAPMAGITDCAFRSFMKSMGASVVVTELVSANGLKYSSEKTKKIMQFTEDQRPVGIQIFGEDLDCLSDAALICQDMGADFVDLNFGCPVPKVVKKGAGSAVLKDLNLLRRVIQAAKKQIQIPLTIKIRTGWDENHRNATEVCQIAYEEGVTWVAIHGRTRSKGYSGLADWDYIREVKQNSKIPIIGNGDIVSANMANERLEQSGCDAVMIGRGCLKNPWIFLESLNLKESKNEIFEKDHGEILEILFEKLNQFSEERIIGLQVKKFATWFSAGYPESSQFRKNVFQFKDKNEIFNFSKDYFQNLKGLSQQDTSSEDFLMGGHG
jgi:tRNA-dihydrouridine synthase B